MGPADHAVSPGQGRIATEKARDKHDVIYCLEKCDGSNTGIARVEDRIWALGRAGYPAQTSKYEQHQLFAAWVREKEDFWMGVLENEERLVGEWMAQAHGTRYSLPKGPWVVFDLMRGDKRAPFEELHLRCETFNIPMPKILHIGAPISVEKAMEIQGQGDHGCLDEPEGAVWRVERKGEFDYMTKWVRPDKVDGRYLPEMSGQPPHWNWRP